VTAFCASWRIIAPRDTQTQLLDVPQLLPSLSQRFASLFPLRHAQDRAYKG
jgi:hypothetical protein